MTYENTPAICILASHTERFIEERKFLRGATPATEDWCRSSFKAFLPVLSEPHQSSTALKGALMTRIQVLFTEGRGNKAVSINTYLRCLKAFLRWAHEESILTEPIKLAWLKEEQKVLATFTADQVNRLLRCKPAKRTEHRLRALALTAIDTGPRVSELLGLCRAFRGISGIYFIPSTGPNPYKTGLTRCAWLEIPCTARDDVSRCGTIPQSRHPKNCVRWLSVSIGM